VQQDAAEAWSTVLGCLSRSAPFVKNMFTYKTEESLTCDENPDEPAEVSASEGTTMMAGDWMDSTFPTWHPTASINCHFAPCATHNVQRAPVALALFTIVLDRTRFPSFLLLSGFVLLAQGLYLSIPQAVFLKACC
jgi:hypothetical protein